MNKWTHEEEDRLMKMEKSGMKQSEMAKELGRTENAVRLRIQYLKAGEDDFGTEEPTEPEPSVPEKKRYKIHYTVDGVAGKSTIVKADSERQAREGLLRELNKIDANYSYDITKVEASGSEKLKAAPPEKAKTNLWPKTNPDFRPKPTEITPAEPEPGDSGSEAETITDTEQKQPVATIDSLNRLTVKGVTLTEDELKEFVMFLNKIGKAIEETEEG